MLSDNHFTLEPVPGKDTCKTAILENGERLFIKSLRTYDNSQQMVEELFNEIAEERVLRAFGISDLGHSVEMVDSRLAIVQRHYPKNWTCVEQEGLEITDIEEWAILLTAETWVRQSDRGVGSTHHVGLVVVDGVGTPRYRAIPLDLGNSFVGHPSGYSGLDDDLNPEWIKSSLFWTSKPFLRTSLEEAISIAEKISITQVINGALEHILQATNWSEDIRTSLKNHADRAANFLYVRRPKLREVLLSWWDQTQAAVQSATESVAAQQIAAA